MMKVHGPFIEYNCASCGVLVSEKVLPREAHIKKRMDALKSGASVGKCASCGYSPTQTQGAE